MGICASGQSAEQKAAAKQSKEIEAAAAEAFRIEQEKIKLLLLGAGESGKSTIFKQMKILYGVITDDDKRQVTPVVYNNTITSFKILIDATDSFGYVDNVVAKDSLAFVRELDDDAEIDVTAGTHMKTLWNDPGVLMTWERRSEFQIVESVKAYFNDLDRIMQPDYQANQQDMLLARVRTSGIVTENYMIDGNQFVMYDVGGQRNERKKWIHCFDDVTAVIFCAAISEYDQALYEDANTNRMTEAVELFDEICNNRYFENSSMILFLNKRDLFEEKILKVDIKSIPAFCDFQGGLGDYDLGCEYFLNLFLAKNQNPDRELYHHITCATDTSNVQVVFNACKDIILKGNLKDSGFV